MQFLIDYGYIVLFLFIFLDQIGLPLPSIPVVLAAGALAGMGEMSVFLAILVTVIACLPADLFWYQLGRSRGGKVLTILCSISLEPDSCVRRTELSFERLGPFSLVIAKFVPGLQTIAPPMAGMSEMPIKLFILLDLIGATLWASLLVTLGFFFSDEISGLTQQFADLGGQAALILGLALVLFISAKLLQKQLFIRSLRMRMLDASELFSKFKDDIPPYVIDLRHRLDFNALPHTIPGAVRIPMERIDEHHEHIPRDRDIILYCS